MKALESLGVGAGRYFFWQFTRPRTITSRTWLLIDAVQSLGIQDRRAAQFQIELDTDNVLQELSVNGAIEEMLFAGGTLNLKLLGGPSTGIAAETNA